jgi:hypothetical protein
MSIGDGIYQSVRLFCVTLFLIAFLHVAIPMSQLWMLYWLKRDEQASKAGPQVEVPTFRVAPEPSRGVRL